MTETELRVALVSGGSGAIGQATSRSLAKSGRIVYIGYYKNEETANRLREEICSSTGRAECVHLDVLDSSRVDQALQNIFDREGRLDILVNCAAINIESPAAMMDDASWSQVLDANLDGAFRLCRAAAKFMMLRRWGRIINLSSISASRGGRGQINYAASKAGIEAMTRVLALELGRKGILANCIAPGVIETRMSERIRGEYSDELLSNISLRRFGRPEEVADLIAYLSGETATYITGQVIRVDGGMAL